VVSLTRSSVISVSIVTADWSMPPIEFHHRLDRVIRSRAQQRSRLIRQIADREGRSQMSKAPRFALGLAIVALGFVLIATVSTVAGMVAIVIGVLVMPWFPGMGMGDS
jgi:Flp pilus assembly protein TadB